MVMRMKRRQMLFAGLGATALAAAGVSLIRPGGLVRPAMAGPAMTVFKDPWCGCCTGWIDHMQAAGYRVQAVDVEETGAVKARLVVPLDLASCHTAEVGGYVVEGHVPAAAVARLLAERPAVAGLAVPGMPPGAPGMEIEGAEPDLYDVIAFGADGTERVFMSFRGAEPV